MNFLKALFPKREKWIEFDTLYSIERLEQLRFFMVENHIPYKVRTAPGAAECTDAFLCSVTLPVVCFRASRRCASGRILSS